MSNKNLLSRSVALAVAVVLLGCSERDAPEHVAAPQSSSSVGASMMSCPASASIGTARTLPPAGGAVETGGHRVIVPSNAISDSTHITIDVPAGDRMQVNLRANGQNHWQFLDGLVITIDYGRCPASEYAGRTLSVWLVNETTGEPLQPMGGVDDRANRRITFETDHFSGYAIAN